MQNLFWIFAGIILAGGLILFARNTGSYPKEKKIYAVGLIVASLLYVGFGFFSDSLSWILTEFGGLLFFAVFAFLSFRFSGWFLSAGWALHILWDVVLHDHSTGFVPDWYRMLCLGFDLLIAGYSGFRAWSVK